MTNIKEVEQALKAEPFEPFVVVTTDGKQYRVARRECGFVTKSYLNVLQPPAGDKRFLRGPMQYVPREKIAEIKPDPRGA